MALNYTKPPNIDMTMKYGETPLTSGSPVSKGGSTSSLQNIPYYQQSGGASYQQGGTGGIYQNKPNNTNMTGYYNQLQALKPQGETQNYFTQASNDINNSGAMDSVMQNIKEQYGWAHPYGSSIGDQQLASTVANTMMSYISPYAQQLGSQAFQGNQNLVNQTAGLYGQQQGLNMQGGIAAGSQWLQNQQLGQQADQWQQGFDRQGEWYQDAQDRQNQMMGGGGGAVSWSGGGAGATAGAGMYNPSQPIGFGAQFPQYGATVGAGAGVGMKGRYR